MSYSKSYLVNHNIGWFACIDGIWIYAASRGGMLPNEVDDDIILPQIQSICSNLPNLINSEEDGIVLNHEFVDTRYKRAIDIYRKMIDNEADFQDFIQSELSASAFENRFTEIFRDMSYRGFYSFVRENIDDIYDNKYRLVCYPANHNVISFDKVIDSLTQLGLANNDINKYIKKITLSSQLENRDKNIETKLNIILRHHF